MMRKLISIVPFLERLRSQEPRSIALRQKILVFGVGGVLLMVFLIVSGLFESSEKSSTLTKKENQKPAVIKFEGPASSSAREEVWVRRLENEASSMREDKKTLDGKLDLMTKKVEVLEKLLQKGLDPVLDEAQQEKDNDGSFQFPEKPGPHVKPMRDESLDPSSREDAFDEPMNFLPSQPKGHGDTARPYGPHMSGEPLPEGYKSIATIKRTKASEHIPIVEGSIPAGSRVTGTMISGLAVSTSTNSQADPHPIIIRLTHDFLMPRGFTAPLKGAVVVGKCHGDRSSERAFCVLETISYVEASGEIVEEKIQGWVFGEDGRYGLRGLIVDRTDTLLRDSLLAGTISGLSGFFKAETTSSVFPVSPFGQTNALKPSEMLKAGATNGVGQALDKLAQFYIDSAEKMSPVLLINPGRNIDIVLKAKFDLTKSLYRRARVNGVEGSRRAFALDHAQKMSQTMEVRKDLK